MTRAAHTKGSPRATPNEVANKHAHVPLRPAAPRRSDISFLCLGGKEGGGKKTVCCHGNNKLLLGEKCGGAAMLPAGWGGGTLKRQG